MTETAPFMGGDFDPDNPEHRIEAIEAAHRQLEGVLKSFISNLEPLANFTEKQNDLFDAHLERFLSRVWDDVTGAKIREIRDSSVERGDILSISFNNPIVHHDFSK